MAVVEVASVARVDFDVTCGLIYAASSMNQTLNKVFG